MVRSGRPDSAAGQQSLGDLVSGAAKDVSQLVRYEISLAKSELKMDARRIGIAAALAVVGLFVGCLLVVLLCFAFAYGLNAAGIWLWASFLIVAGTCLLLIALAGLIAYGRIRKVTGMKMTRKTVVDDLGMLRRGESGPERLRPGHRQPGSQPWRRRQGRDSVSSVTEKRRRMPAEPDIEINGPWTHRDVTANGTRFHLASIGEGPLVLLLHGFPEFWWTWRHQLVALAEAGYRAVAVDLRGYGGSDKPPRGYDLITAAADAAGLISALGEANAVVVGHDWGGLTAWTLAAYFPKAVRRLAIVSMAHPLRMRAAVLSSPLSVHRSIGWPAAKNGRGGYPLVFQVPMLPERRLVRDGGALVGTILSSWSAPGWPDQETAQIYQTAMRIPPVAHTSLEYQRWFVRSTFRPDGLRYARQMRSPVAAPVLHLHGAIDPCILPQTARGAGRYVEGPYRWKVIEGAGHYPHEERPELFDSELLGWLADPEPDR